MIIHIALPQSLLAVGTDTGALSVSAFPSYTVLWQIERAHRGAVTALACSPDGQLLASGGIDGAVHLWSVGCGKCWCTYHRAFPVTQLLWSSSTVLLGCSPQHITSWTVPQMEVMVA